MKQVCCFAGHRIESKERYIQIKKRLESEIENLINQGVAEFRVTGEPGFDTMAALEVLSAQEKHPQIKLVAIISFPKQSQKWSAEEQAIYNQILKKADKIITLAEEYYDGCTYDRNTRLISGSDICICYLKHIRGGTVYKVNYAKKSGLRIINLAINFEK